MGVLSDRMVLAAGGWEEADLRAHRIRELAPRMSSVTLDPQCSVSSAATALAEDRAEAALVMEHNRLVGIVTETDLVRWLAQADHLGA
ncbi:MAG: CBS domain-containing protein [Actinomycetales bacterium]